MQILEFINKFIQILSNDNILNLSWVAYSVLALVFFVPFFVSKWFKWIGFRIILVIFGLAFLSDWGQVTITRDFNFLIGIALITPHIKYFFDLVKDTLFNIFIFFLALFIQLKNATVNTYFFFITIYYKILRLINWFVNIFIFLKAFIETFSERFKTKEQNQNYQDYSNKSEYKEEKQNSNNEKAYEDFKKSHGYQESKKEESTKQKVDDKYKQFYSSNPYEVLGVKPSDDFSIIKKSYRALIRIYHPDLNPQDIEFFTEITQNLNNAYEKLQKTYGK